MRSSTGYFDVRRLGVAITGFTLRQYGMYLTMAQSDRFEAFNSIGLDVTQ